MGGEEGSGVGGCMSVVGAVAGGLEVVALASSIAVVAVGVVRV